MHFLRFGLTRTAGKDLIHKQVSLNCHPTEVFRVSVFGHGSTRFVQELSKQLKFKSFWSGKNSRKNPETALLDGHKD